MRNQSVELLRVLLMLGICGIHVAAFMGGGWKYLDKTLWPCVVAFVFISGYYGVKFSVKKVVRLCGMGVWCAIVAAGLTFAFLRGGVHAMSTIALYSVIISVSGSCMRMCS